MSGQRNFNATITTRYGVPEKSTYEKVMEIVKKERIAKSRAQLLLVQRGLHHTDNPEPLVKEKVVYKDRPVEKVVNKVIEKVVYRDKPAVNHVTQEHIGGSDTGQRPSAGKLTTQGKADPPSNTALKEKKPVNSLDWVGWLGLAAVLGVVWWFTKK